MIKFSRAGGNDYRYHSIGEKRMRTILITNDDGINADGLIRLAGAAVSFGEVYVVAPEKERSAASHSITLRKPIDIYEAEFPVEGVKAFSCSGTPGDCVRVGSIAVMPKKPDIVLSGINYGYNVASDTQYSATVGGALEAAFQGYPAIAFSEGTYLDYEIKGNPHEVTDHFLMSVLEEYIDMPFTEGQVLNVNFPPVPLAECKGILRDRKLSKGMIFRDEYDVIEELPGGGKRYMVNGKHVYDAEEGTDLRAVYDKYVSIGYVKNLS